MDLAQTQARYDELVSLMKALVAPPEGAADDWDMTRGDAARFDEAEGEAAKLRDTLKDADRRIDMISRSTSVMRGDDGDDHDRIDDESPGLTRGFEKYLRSGVAGQDLLRAQSVGTNTAGGFAVPTLMLDKVTERMRAHGGLATLAEEFTTTSGAPVEWPTVDDTAKSGEVVAEGAAGTGGTDITFGTMTLGAHRYAAPGADNAGADPIRVSVELLQDAAFDIGRFVARKLGERLARAQSADWVIGTGTNEPAGITTSTGPSATFTGAAPTYAELVDGVHSVDPTYRENGAASWVFNDQTFAAIEKLVDGSGRPLWLNSRDSGIEGAPFGTLLGHRVVLDQGFADFTDASSNKWGVFGNVFAGYIIRRVREVTVLVDPYSRAAFGQVNYFAWARADGGIQDKNAFTVLANDAV